MPKSKNTVCQVQDLSFNYGGCDVLAGIRLEARAGEMAVLAGPNGSGKTSLLRVLAGLEVPVTGTVFLFGRDAKEISAKERSRRIAYVPQTGHEDVPFTVRQLVSLGRAPWQNRLGSVSAKDVQVTLDSLRLVQAEHLADRPLRRLSGGERQRAAIARALCQKAELLLLDEPTSALDYGHQIQIMDMLARLCQERKVTILMVSHDVNLAAMYADQLFLMKEGRIVAGGTPETTLILETVSALYGCPMLVDTNPCTRTPRISPLPMAFEKDRRP